MLIYLSQARLDVHPWLLEEVSNHSYGMYIRPDVPTPQVLHLLPQAIRNFFYMVIIEDAPQGSNNQWQFVCTIFQLT